VALDKKYLTIESLVSSIAKGLKANWVSFTPPKVQTFVWQLFLGRLPPRGNLANRRILINSLDGDCV